MTGSVCSAVTTQAFFTLQDIRCIWKKFSFFAADIHHTKWKILPLHRKWEIDHMFASKFSLWVFNDFSEDIWSVASVYILFWNIFGCTHVDQVLANFRDPLHRMYYNHCTEYLEEKWDRFPYFFKNIKLVVLIVVIYLLNALPCRKDIMFD